MVGAGRNVTFLSPPRPRTSSGAGDPHAPFLIGSARLTSAAIGASSRKHSRRPPVSSACVQASSTISPVTVSSPSPPDAVASGLFVAPDTEPMGAVCPPGAGCLAPSPGRNGNTTMPARSASESQIEIPESPLSGAAMLVFRLCKASRSARRPPMCAAQTTKFKRRARQK